MLDTLYDVVKEKTYLGGHREILSQTISLWLCFVRTETKSWCSAIVWTCGCPCIADFESNCPRPMSQSSRKAMPRLVRSYCICKSPSGMRIQPVRLHTKYISMCLDWKQLTYMLIAWVCHEWRAALTRFMGFISLASMRGAHISARDFIRVQIFRFIMEDMECSVLFSRQGFLSVVLDSWSGIHISVLQTYCFEITMLQTTDGSLRSSLSCLSGEGCIHHYRSNIIGHAGESHC